MSSALEAEQPKGRERLIEAAVRLFGRDGFDATSLRAVAEEAGVSWGLVRFYFGSKEGLRDAAEARVVDGYLDRVLAGSMARDLKELMQAIDASETEKPSLPEVARYLRRAIIEERPMAVEFVRRLIAVGEPGHFETLAADFPGEAWLRDLVPSLSRRLGALVAAPLFEAILGRDVFSLDDLRRRNADELRMWELIRLGLEAERAGARPSTDIVE